MSANVYVDHPAESGLLDTLVQAAVHERAERRGFGSVPHLTEIKACWQATINLFWQEEDDRQVKDAIHEEQVVATSWHTQLQGVAQQFHAAGRKQQRWRAQIYEYWRVYLAFVRKRYEKLRDMITEGQIEQARRFVVRSGMQSVPAKDSLSSSIAAVRHPVANLPSLGQSLPFRTYGQLDVQSAGTGWRGPRVIFLLNLVADRPLP